jgi:hypothetical protein
MRSGGERGQTGIGKEREQVAGHLLDAGAGLLLVGHVGAGRFLDDGKLRAGDVSGERGGKASALVRSA